MDVGIAWSMPRVGGMDTGQTRKEQLATLTDLKHSLMAGN